MHSIGLKGAAQGTGHKAKGKNKKEFILPFCLTPCALNLFFRQSHRILTPARWDRGLGPEDQVSMLNKALILCKLSILATG